MQRITVLLNLHAGPQDDSAVERVAAVFRRAGPIEPDLRVVEGQLVRTVASEALARGSRVIVAGGGDGTVSAVASAIAGTDASLGILPFGTLNHFAKDVGVPLDLDDARLHASGGGTGACELCSVPRATSAPFGRRLSLSATTSTS